MHLLGTNKVTNVCPTCGCCFFFKKGYQRATSDGDVTAEIPTVKPTVRFEAQRSQRVAHSVVPPFRKSIVLFSKKSRCSMIG